MQLLFVKRHDWSKNSGAPAFLASRSRHQQSKHVDSADSSSATYRVFERKFDIKAQCERDVKDVNSKRKI